MYLTLQEKATLLLSPTSGVNSAAQPRFLHHAIVPEGAHVLCTVLFTRTNINPHWTDSWIELR